MLVLTRRSGERIVIGQNIVLKVLDVHRDRVQLGFDAPPEIAIHRHEVYLRIQGEENNERQAADRTRATCP